MRILVTGRDGQIGRELARVLPPVGEVIAVGRGECDLARPAQLRDVIRAAHPDLIVNAAAYTAVDQAESEPALAHAVNGAAPGLIADEARRSGAALIHYSTDYVFDGDKPSPYAESDATNPLSVYGRSKLAGEQAIEAAGAPHLILRTSWVYAARGKNFVNTIIRLARERDVLSVVDDQWGAPTWARSVAEATLAIVAHAGRDHAGVGEALRARGGIFHLAAAGATNWFEFARAVLTHVADPARRLRQLQPIASRDYPTAARRPMNSRLDCTRLSQQWGIALPAWDHALALCLADIDAPG